MKNSAERGGYYPGGVLSAEVDNMTPSEICRILIIIHSKYFPDSDGLKAHS